LNAGFSLSGIAGRGAKKWTEAMRRRLRTTKGLTAEAIAKLARQVQRAKDK
jgi:hypothetical protein